MIISNEKDRLAAMRMLEDAELPAEIIITPIKEDDDGWKEEDLYAQFVE